VPQRSSRFSIVMLALGILAGMFSTAFVVLAARRANHRRALERARVEAVQPTLPVAPPIPPVIAPPIVQAPIAPPAILPPAIAPAPVVHNMPTATHAPTAATGHGSASHSNEPSTPHSTNAPGTRDPSVHEGFQAPHSQGAANDGVDPHEL
jgi:hypothetical protein